MSFIFQKKIMVQENEKGNSTKIIRKREHFKVDFLPNEKPA